MKTIAYISVIVLLVFSGPCFSEYYKWQDENGVWHFTETPPPEGTAYEQGESTDTQPPAAKSLKAVPRPVVPGNDPEDQVIRNVVESPSPLERRREFHAEMESGFEVIDRFQLNPKQRKRLSIKATERTYVGYYSDISDEDSRRCGYCVRLKQEGIRASVESPGGGGQDLMPFGGVINFFIENLATFPIEVEVYTSE
jgi:hypothetical protein